MYLARELFSFSRITFAGLVYVPQKLGQNNLSAILTYGILFFMGSFPSFFAFTYYFFQGSKNIFAVNEIDIVQLIGTPRSLFGTEFNNLPYALAHHVSLFYYLFLLAILATLFLASNREKFIAVLKNIRPPQILYHSGLFLMGIGLGFLAYLRARK
jgi:hypothetical protein